MTKNARIAIDTIADRLSYVAWRTDWRDRYAAASEHVRDAKRELVRIRAAWRSNVANDGTRSWEFQINSLNEDLPYRRRRANDLMVERQEATDRRDELMEALRASSQALAA
jgi:hypothetical protein